MFLIGVGLIALVVVLIVIFGSGGNTSVNSNSGNSANGVLANSDGKVKEFNLVANEFKFIPGTITVNEGDKVILHIESLDVEHGIAIPQFGVSQTLPVGENVTVEFVADKVGTYSFHCNVYCGSGHREMEGTLIVN
ncbi:hypothetical protein GW931_03055 [archaeon]|nr:hypothetical protein [archaeon]